MVEPNSKVEGEIHEFEFNPQIGMVHRDIDGEILEGFYWRIVKVESKQPICNYIGPYRDKEDAEEACVRAWQLGDY